MSNRRDRTSGTHDGRLHGADVTFRKRGIVSGALELTARLDGALHGHAFTTNSEIVALVTLHLSGPQRAYGLCEATQMTRAGTTNLIDRLEAGGLVRRTNVETDHRGVLVELTPAGADATVAIVDLVTDVVLDAAPLVASLGEHLFALGVDIGLLQLPAGSVEQRLEWLTRFLSSGEHAQIMYVEAFGVPTGRSLLHLLILATEPGGTGPAALAAAMRISSATVSDLLTRAEQDGLITRTSGRKPDRRVTMVEATDRGRTALDRALKASDPLVSALAATLFAI